MKAQIYRNLNKRPLVAYSVRLKGKVVDYVTSAVLEDVTFKHPTPGALHRVRTGPREVCAWATGTLTHLPVDEGFPPSSTWHRLNCDPKKHDGFTDVDGRRIYNVKWLVLTTTGEAFFK